METMENPVYLAILTQILPIIILLSVYVLIPVVVVVGIVRYFRAMSEERRRLRLEVSKLAHEMESISNQLSVTKVPPHETTAADENS